MNGERLRFANTSPGLGGPTPVNALPDALLVFATLRLGGVCTTRTLLEKPPAEGGPGNGFCAGTPGLDRRLELLCDWDCDFTETDGETSEVDEVEDAIECVFACAWIV